VRANRTFTSARKRARTECRAVPKPGAERAAAAFGFALGLLATLALARVAAGDPAPGGSAVPDAAPVPIAADAAGVTEVKVERVRPRKEKHPTLRFLKENRDFIRARFDRLRERPVTKRGVSQEIDPRFLAYQEMLARLTAGKDSVAAAEEVRRRRNILVSVTELGDLERELDLLERLLEQQRTRLGVLQEDFTGDQRTALIVVVSGDPGEIGLEEIAVTIEDGAKVAVPLSEEQRRSLRQGGAIQVFHAFVEPRRQVVEVGLAGGRWPAGESGFVTLEPTRDRLTLLELRLGHLDPQRGASSIQAGTRLHDSRMPKAGG
jgi:hypothetical protein